jgi:hypothetical protein
MRMKRSDVPEELAAKLLFDSDRTCCVCQVPGKRLQIPLRANMRETVDPLEFSVQGGEAKGA